MTPLPQLTHPTDRRSRKKTKVRVVNRRKLPAPLKRLPPLKTKLLNLPRNRQPLLPQKTPPQSHWVDWVASKVAELGRGA